MGYWCLIDRIANPGLLGHQRRAGRPGRCEPIRQALIEYRANGEALLRERFERARADGDLPETADCATLAAYIMAMTHGLAVQAKAGFRREVLQAVAEQAMAGWPADPRSGQAGARRA